MQFKSMIAFVYLQITIHLSRGQLFYNSFGGFGDWFGSTAFVHSVKGFPTRCLRMPCIPWSNLKIPMYPEGGNMNAFNGNMGDQFNPFNRKPPTEGNINQNGPTEDSNTEDNSEEDLKPKDSSKGGLNKATSSTISPPLATTVSESPLKTRAFPPEYTNTGDLKEFKINKTSEKGFSPLIQVYVITSGNGGAHTSIGEGGYHGSNNGYTTNGVSKDSEAAHKFEPPNVKVQAFIPQNRKPSSISDGPPFPSGPFEENSNRNPPNPSSFENGGPRNNGEFASETKRKAVQDELRDAFPVFWLRKK